MPVGKMVRIGVWEGGSYIGCVLFARGANNHIGSFLRKHCPGIRLIVSYADPDQGHHGGIYQAANFIYSGRSHAQREIAISGREMHKRSAFAKWGTASPTKITAMTGIRVSYGPVRWKHTYLMPLDNDMRQRIASLAKPYPKRVKQATDGHHPASGGAEPTHTLQPAAA